MVLVVAIFDSLSSIFKSRSSILDPRSSIRYWLPPLLWMAAIFFFSTDNFSGEKTGGLLFRLFHALIPGLTPAGFKPWHFLIRKAAHFTEYALLALLLFRAFRAGAVVRWRRRWALQALWVVVAYALLDEYHQTRTANRVGSIYDSLVDVAGGVAALATLWWKRRGQ
ncbi:MAG: VanZ family protein [Blastocatellia bacterium]